MRLLQSLLLVLFLMMNVTFVRANTKTYTFNSSKSKISIPFKLFNNIIIVDVKINETKTLKFIFDSGCKSTIVIHPKWIDSFEIPLHQKVFFSGLGIRDSIETRKMENGRIDIDLIHGENIPIFFLTKDTLNLDHYLGTDVDGIFGAELFERYYIFINYKKRMIDFYHKKPVKKINSTFAKLPVQIRKSKGYINCAIMNSNNEIFMSELLLDTGSNIPIIIKNKVPSDLNLNQYIQAEIGEGLSGAMYSSVGRIKRLFIDTLRFDSVIIAFNETPITFKEPDENTLDGNIGNDILNRMDIYFAYPEKYVYFNPNRNMHDKFEFNISNIILLENKTKNGGFIIKSIAENSPPLMAGLQQGDEIIKIDTYKGEDIHLEDALRLLNKRIGKKINIQYKRNGISNKISYKLSSII
ncbi:MAG: aspartyl protease family protein [Chitinophagaceae bacterium]|nr:aspartyl protease family protein [Chitinophagaceae bacterium]